MKIKRKKERKKKWHIHDLVHVTNSHAKFQLNRIKKKNQLKLLDTERPLIMFKVTETGINEQSSVGSTLYHDAKFDIYVILLMPEKIAPLKC